MISWNMPRSEPLAGSEEGFIDFAADNVRLWVMFS